MHLGHFGLVKVLVVSISFALAICFVGCGDDSSSGVAGGTDSKTELNSEADADTADVPDDADVSSSSKDDEDEEISSDSDDEEEDDDAEEAESSSSSAKKAKSSSSKARSSSSKAKSSSSKSKPSSSEDSEEPDDPEDPGVEPAKPESSSSGEAEYPDLHVLSDPNLKQGCDIDKNDDVWVIPSFGSAVQKTVYIWRGDEYSATTLLEMPFADQRLCEMFKESYTSTLLAENGTDADDAESYCDGGTLRIIVKASKFVKGDRDLVFESATLLCLDEDEESN